MLIYSMSVSVDGFIADRAGAFSWSVPNEDQSFPRHADTKLGGFLLGRRLYETMLVWETDPSMAAVAVELGLVDELHMFRHPVVVGGGTPFLPPVTEDVTLKLIETRTFASRVIYERYRRVRDDSDGHR